MAGLASSLFALGSLMAGLYFLVCVEKLGDQRHGYIQFCDANLFQYTFDGINNPNGMMIGAVIMFFVASIVACIAGCIPAVGGGNEAKPLKSAEPTVAAP